MSGLGVSALTSSAIAGARTLTTRKAYIQAMQTSSTPPHTLIQVDASLRENHSIDAPPSEFPIESGQVITDNIIIKPFSLDMEGIISDNPLSIAATGVTSVLSTFLPPTGLIAGGAAIAAYNALQGTQNPSVANFNQFLKLISNKTPVNVYTTLFFYKSMWLSTLRVNRDATTGNCLSFNAHFVQIILVKPQTVNVAKYANPSVSAGQANLGKASGSQFGSKASLIFNNGVAKGDATSQFGKQLTGGF